MRFKLFVAACAVLACATVAPAAKPNPDKAPKAVKSKKVKASKQAKLVRAAQAKAAAADYSVPPASPENMWDIDLSTGGRVVIQMRPDKAPNMVARVRQLTCSGFYSGLSFHRVIDGFMAQGGDPRGTGEGGSTLPDVAAEFNDLPHVRGAVAAARAASEDSANSQFYIMFQPNLKLDKHYTVFGRVVSGMAYVDALHRGEPPADPSKIVRASIEGGCAGVAPVANALPAVAPGAAAPAAASEGPQQPAAGDSTDN